MATMRFSQLNWLTSGILATFFTRLLTGCGGANGAVSPIGGPPAAVSLAPVSPPTQALVMPTTSRTGHMFVIVLENKDYIQTFGPGSQAPYPANALTSQGALLAQYYGIGHNNNDNHLTMISGRAPNARTQADCQYYTGRLDTMSPDTNGQMTGTGYVYPAATGIIASQLDAKGLAWRGYMEDMGNDLMRDGRSTCSHPAFNGKDGTQSATATGGYATCYNPFMYFHSAIDNQPYCDSHVVRLDSLATDLNSVATTFALSFIVPNLCNDGHDEPTCVDGESAGGLPVVNRFLQAWVPQIINSPAFQSDGLSTITLDEADTNDISACCDELTGPNSVAPGLTGPGGGRAGAVVLFPFVKSGMVSNMLYNHYALPKSIEDAFGLSHLGYVGMNGLQGSGSDVYSAAR